MAENKQVKIATKKSSSYEIIIAAAVCVALILVATFVGVCYLMPSGNERKPSHSVVTNFSDGAWANYAIESYYETGAAKGHGILNSTIAAGVHDEKVCWVYLENYTFTYNNGTVVNDLVTNYLDKSTYSNMQVSQQRFINGELAFNDTYGPDAVDFVDDLSLYSNMTVSATGQSVSVHAGTFNTLVRKE